jgi:hypothetical protein
MAYIQNYVRWSCIIIHRNDSARKQAYIRLLFAVGTLKPREEQGIEKEQKVLSHFISFHIMESLLPYIYLVPSCPDFLAVS